MWAFLPYKNLNPQPRTIAADSFRERKKGSCLVVARNPSCARSAPHAYIRGDVIAARVCRLEVGVIALAFARVDDGVFASAAHTGRVHRGAHGVCTDEENITRSANIAVMESVLGGFENVACGRGKRHEVVVYGVGVALFAQSDVFFAAGEAREGFVYQVIGNRAVAVTVVLKGVVARLADVRGSYRKAVVALLEGKAVAGYANLCPPNAQIAAVVGEDSLRAVRPMPRYPCG